MHTTERAADNELRKAMWDAHTAADLFVRDWPRVVVPMKDCPRCGGKGYAHFLGNDRAPGACFRCSGSGRLPATRADAKKVQDSTNARDLARLRHMWRAMRAALQNTTGCSAYAVQSANAELERVRVAGMDAAKRACGDPFTTTTRRA